MKKIRCFARPILIPIIFISVLLTLFISGCVPSTNTIDKKTVEFWLSVFPNFGMCGFGQSTDEFNDAVIKVNDIQLAFGGGSFFGMFNQSLNTGDTANIYFHHPKLGTYNWSIVIPSPVPNLISPPDLATLNAWANGDIQTLTLNWSAASNCDLYDIYVERFNSDQILINGIPSYPTGTSIVLDREILKLEDSTYAPYFKINVQSIKSISLDYLFNSQSTISAVSSVCGPLQNF